MENFNMTVAGMRSVTCRDEGSGSLAILCSASRAPLLLIPCRIDSKKNRQLRCPWLRESLLLWEPSLWYNSMYQIGSHARAFLDPSEEIPRTSEAYSKNKHFQSKFCALIPDFSHTLRVAKNFKSVIHSNVCCPCSVLKSHAIRKQITSTVNEEKLSIQVSSTSRYVQVLKKAFAEEVHYCTRPWTFRRRAKAKIS